MKENEGFVDYPDQQMIIYVEKEDGKFGPMQTGSFLSANYLDDYFFKRRNLELELREQLTGNLISPVKYFMVLEELSLSELASRAGIRKSRVKKHLDPKHFGSASLDELRRYASVFNVPAANLLQVILIRPEDSAESSLMPDDQRGGISVEQPSTANPFVVVTKIELKNR
ncbi:MAG: hypothetical protein WCO44_13385 [Bacteroidota bacterium]